MKRTILVATLVLGSSVCSQSFGFDLLDRMLGLKGCGAASSCCDTVVCDDPCEPACGLEAACGCADPCGEPACGLEAACGCADPCGEPACGLEAACGCADPCGEPACGLEAACGCADPCGEPACGLESAFGCADGCEPACGCEIASCDSPCRSNGGLLNKLFSGGLLEHGCDSACDNGCGLGDMCAPACGLESACAPACDSCCTSKRPRLLETLFGHLKNDSCCDAACDAAPCGCSSAPVMAAPAPADEEAAPMPPAPVVDPSAHLQSKRRVIQASASYIR